MGFLLDLHLFGRIRQRQRLNFESNLVCGWLWVWLDWTWGLVWSLDSLALGVVGKRLGLCCFCCYCGFDRLLAHDKCQIQWR